MTTDATTRALCLCCEGNGVIKIPGGVSLCPRCDGDCYDPRVCRSCDALTARVQALEAALRWLVALHHGVGMAGGSPEPGEWEAALEAGGAALTPREEPTS